MSAGLRSDPLGGKLYLTIDGVDVLDLTPSLLEYAGAIQLTGSNQAANLVMQGRPSITARHNAVETYLDYARTDETQPVVVTVGNRVFNVSSGELHVGGSDVVDYGTSLGFYYVRFYNGVQIVWARVSQELLNQVARASSFTFPAAFVDTNYRATGAEYNGSAFWNINTYNHNTGYMGWICRHINGGSVTQTVYAEFIIIGRWY